VRLTTTRGRGALTVFTLTTADGHATSLVCDPANEHRPAVDLRTWVADTGGAASLDLADGGPRRGGFGPDGVLRF
jgi:hypothetical protein